MKRGSKSRTSASHHTTTSPVEAYSDFQRASPLPCPRPCSVSTSAAATTRAPAAAASSPVRSVEWSSTTTISSTRPRPSTSWVRMVETIAPTVGSSLRAGMQTETVVVPLAATSASTVKSAASWVWTWGGVTGPIVGAVPDRGKAGG